MNLLEKLTSIDKKKIQRDDMLEQLEGVIYEYDEKDQDSIDNANTVLEILEDLYPGILPTDKGEEKNEEVEDSSKKQEAEKKKDHPDNKEQEEERKAPKPEVKNFLGKDEKIAHFKKADLEYDDEKAKVLMDALKVWSYRPLEAAVIERKDGTEFRRNYLDDFEAKEAFEDKKPLYSADGKGFIFGITTPAEFIQSTRNGHNHFIADKENIQEITERESKGKHSDKKEESGSNEKSRKAKITNENRGDCEIIVSEIRSVLDKYKSTKAPKANREKAKKKPLAAVVKDNVVSIIKRVLNKEKERNPKKKINLKQFEIAVDKGKEFLKALRKASGGISDDNDQMISSFESQMNEIIEAFKAKQQE